MSKKKVLVMCLADPSGNPRPKRVIELCKKMELIVDVAGFPMKTSSLNVDNYYLISVPSKNIIKRFIRLFFRFQIWLNPFPIVKNFANNYYFGVTNLEQQLDGKQYNLLIVEDLQLLPLAQKIRNQAKIIFDAREYYPKQHENDFIFRFLEAPERIRLCKRFLHLCESVITVSPGLSEAYKQNFNISTELIRSVPSHSNSQVNQVSLTNIHMVHHGVVNKSRKLEKMIHIFSQLDKRFSLDFYLVGNEKYINELKKIALPYKGIKFKSPVSFDEIIPMLNSYDVGFYYLEPTGFNVKFCLPNKLFEFIQARLMIAIGPSPDMAALVEEYHCGIVADSFIPEKMANSLNALTSEQIMIYKQNSDKAAEKLCFEQESIKLQNIITNLCY